MISVKIVIDHYYQRIAKENDLSIIRSKTNGIGASEVEQEDESMSKELIRDYLEETNGDMHFESEVSRSFE